MRRTLTYRILLIGGLYLLIRLLVEYGQDGGFDYNFVIHQAFIGLALGIALVVFDRGSTEK